MEQVPCLMPWPGIIPRLVSRVEKRKLSGNCAPLEKNLEQYLKDNPNCEVVTKCHPRVSGITSSCYR